MGSGGNSGTTSNVFAYIAGGRTNASLLPLQLDERGDPRITGTVTSQTASSLTIEINGGHSMADFRAPNNISDSDPGYLLMSIRWGAGREGVGHIRDMSFDNIESSGTTLVLHGGGIALGTGYPANNTVVRLHLFAGGLAEIDLACQASAFEKHNFKALAAGGGAIVQPLGSGETLPASLAGTPSFGSLVFPPFHPTTGVPASYAVIPAGYLYEYGEWPDPGSRVVAPMFWPPAATYSGTQTVSIICPTAGATIYYTTDGNDPTTSSATLTSGGTLNVAATTTLKAFAVKSGAADSTVTSGTYTIGAGSPAPYQPGRLRFIRR